MKKVVTAFSLLAVLASSPMMAFADTTSTSTNTSTTTGTSANSNSNTGSGIGTSTDSNSSGNNSTDGQESSNVTLTASDVQAIISGLSTPSPSQASGQSSSSSHSTSTSGSTGTITSDSGSSNGTGDSSGSNTSQGTSTTDGNSHSTGTSTGESHGQSGGQSSSGQEDQTQVSESAGQTVTKFTHTSITPSALQSELDSLAGTKDFEAKMQITDSSTGQQIQTKDPASIQAILDAVIQQGQIQFIENGITYQSDNKTVSTSAQVANVTVPTGSLTLDVSMQQKQSGNNVQQHMKLTGVFQIAEGTKTYLGKIQGSTESEKKSSEQLSPVVSKDHKEIELKGKAVSAVPSIVYHGTTYMPIWYIMQVIKKLGYNNAWDGYHWNIQGTAPSGTTTSTSSSISNSASGDAIEVNGQTVANVTALSYQNTTYMPIWYVMQALKHVNVKTSWDGAHWNVDN